MAMGSMNFKSTGSNSLGDQVSTAAAAQGQRTFTVRELIMELAKANDMDAEVAISFFNSDPVPVASGEENEDGQFVLGNV